MIDRCRQQTGSRHVVFSTSLHSSHVFHFTSQFTWRYESNIEGKHMRNTAISVGSGVGVFAGTAGCLILTQFAIQVRARLSPSGGLDCPRAAGINMSGQDLFLHNLAEFTDMAIARLLCGHFELTTTSSADTRPLGNFILGRGERALLEHEEFITRTFALAPQKFLH